MAVIAFSRPVILPIAPLREALTSNLPLYHWQVGEHDDGSPKQMGVFAPHQIVVGRFEGQVIFTELTANDGAIDTPAPPHSWHVLIGAPTIDTPALADRITLVICGVLMILDEHLSRCQLRPEGPWLSAEEVVRALKLVANGESVAVTEGLGIPAAHFAGAPVERRVDADATDPRLAAIAAVELIAPPLPPEARRAIAEHRPAPDHQLDPQPDPAPPADTAPQPNWPDIPRRPGGFGRKGL